MVTYTEKTEKGYDVSLMYKGWVKIYLSIDSKVDPIYQDRFDQSGSEKRWVERFQEMGINEKDYKIVTSSGGHTVHLAREELAVMISEKISE